MTLPNFIIVGAAKSGTTALYHYLQEHPQVFMTDPKEPKFFAYEGEKIQWRGPGDREKNRRTVTRWEDYQALFAGVNGEKAIGEASAAYLYVPKAAERIKYYVPEAKLFAVLRHPADRAYSAYTHLLRDGRERVLSFEEALRKEPERIRNQYNMLWHLKSMGFYFPQVKRYFDLFGRDRLRVFLYEDWQSNPMGVVKEVFQILGVDDSFVSNVPGRFNVGVLPKSRTLDAALIRARRNLVPYLAPPLRWRVNSRLEKLIVWNRLTPTPLSPETRAHLINEYREDILRLQDLLGRDLTHWLH